MTNVRVDNNSTVTQIVAVQEDLANVEFRFTASYAGLGVIKIEGSLDYECEAQALADMWAKSGKMSSGAANEIHNAIMSSCLQEAVIIARDLRLPPPLPLPVVNIKGGGKKSTGVEVA